MAINIYEYPEISHDKAKKAWIEAEEATGLSLSISFLPMLNAPKSSKAAHYDSHYACFHPSLKIAGLNCGIEENLKEKITSAMDDLGYRVFPEAFDWKKNNSLPINAEIISEIRKREGIINNPVKELIDQLPIFEEVSKYFFSVYDPTRINVNGTTDHFELERFFIDHTKQFVSFELEDRCGIDSSLLEDQLKLMGVGPECAVALSSGVMTRQGIRHIPMIDFANNAYDEDAEELVSRLGLAGIFVDSGNSLHFYGDSLQSERDREKMLCQISEHPDVGQLWSDLQIDQGFSLLRLTPCSVKIHFPEFYYEWK